MIAVAQSLEHTMAMAAYAFLEQHRRDLDGVSLKHLATAESLAAETSSKPLMMLCVEARRAHKRTQAISRRDARLTRIVNLKLKGASDDQVDAVFAQVLKDEERIDAIDAAATQASDVGAEGDQE